MQSLLAMFLLFFCVVVELIGKPYREVSPAHKILPKLELSALYIEWCTLWSGLMIHEMSRKIEGIKVLMTVIVIIANITLMMWMLAVLLRSYLRENMGGFVAKMLGRCGKPNVLPKKAEDKVSDGETNAVNNSFSDRMDYFMANPLTSEDKTDSTHAIQSSEIELSKVQTGTHREFWQYTTAEGHDYYVDVHSQRSVWELPANAIVLLPQHHS